MTVTGVRPNRTHRRAARTKRDLAAALSAAATLLTLVVGVPVALLATTGWPWPTHAPNAEQIGHDLLQPDDGHLLATVLVAVAWIAWMLFTSGAVIEAVGHVRGTLPRRLPVISPMQQLVAPLIAAVAVLAHSPTASTLTFATASATAEQAPTQQAAAGIPAQPQATQMPASPTTPPAAQARELRLYVVQPAHDEGRDTLWSIAAKHLGDPLRWHEIVELNRGRVQPDGGRLTDPHWIRPGWRFLMPADATGLPLAEPPHPAASSHTEQQLPRQLIAPPPQSNGNPDSQLPLPTTAPAHDAGVSRDRAADSSQQVRDSDPALPAGLAVMGVLAAGVLAIVGRRRALQRRHRRTGEQVRKPPPDAIRTETRLRVAADPPAADTVAEALRALSAADPEQARHVQAAELSGYGLELLLDELTDAPASFVAVDGDARWRLDGHEGTADGHAALPALASIAHRNGRLVFVDLERLHVLYLNGDPAAADRLLSWIAADLAAGAWATTSNLTLVGVAPPLATLDNERIRLHDRLSEDVVKAVESHARDFAACGHADALETRTGDPLEPWPVEVVLVGSAATSSSNAELINRLVGSAGADHRNGVAVVIAGEAGDRGVSAFIHEGRIRIPQLSLEGVVAQLSEQETEDIGQLLHAACDLNSEPPEVTVPATAAYPDGDEAACSRPDLTDEVRSAEHDLDSHVDAYLAADPTALRIQLLGPASVSAPGPLEPKRLPTCTELVVYLACSPRGATLTDVDGVLWPERIIPRHTRNTVITRARAWLARTSTDEPRLSRVDSEGRLHLHDALVDWLLFERLVTRAGTRNDADRIKDLQRAMSLVRGKPFESVPPGRYAWLASRNLEEHMAAAVIDTAHALAAELLATGDAQAARDVARTAQMVDPHDERPWRDLLRAEAALGRPRKIREHVRSLMRILDVEVADELMPETAELISQLLPREPKAATG
jgi:nucleoid-associated protein YgaU/DNA-binding SARP family transcriptional activator